MFIEKELYKNIVAHIPIPTVDILFVNTKGELLLWMRNNEPLKWVYYLPGGRVNKWERSIDAARRKAKEELSLDIDVSRLNFVGVYDDIFDNSVFEDTSTHCIPVTYSYFLSSSEESKLELGDSQHSDLAFFEITDPMLHDMVKLRVNDLNVDNSKFSIRA